jgi:hypothetical protein
MELLIITKEIEGGGIRVPRIVVLKRSAPHSLFSENKHVVL